MQWQPWVMLISTLIWGNTKCFCSRNGEKVHAFLGSNQGICRKISNPALLSPSSSFCLFPVKNTNSSVWKNSSEYSHASMKNIWENYQLWGGRVSINIQTDKNNSVLTSSPAAQINWWAPGAPWPGFGLLSRWLLLSMHRASPLLHEHFHGSLKQRHQFARHHSLPPAWCNLEAQATLNIHFAFNH